MASIIQIPKIKDPNSKERLVVYLTPQMKDRLEQKAKALGKSVTKYVEELIKQNLGI